VQSWGGGGGGELLICLCLPTTHPNPTQHAPPPTTTTTTPTPTRFKRGLLTEAALALEAEVRANPGNAEAWRLLGTVHAENDDDNQAIAAMGEWMPGWCVEGGEVEPLL